MLNPTERAALVRGLYNALGTFLVTFLTAYATTDDVRASAITGAIAALGVLGFRAGAEGMYDSHRAKTGNVKPSDVSPNHPYV